MQKNLLMLLALLFLCKASATQAQVLPGDSIVYGPMFSPVYNDTVRVWVMTKNGTGGNTLSLSLTGTSGTPLTGTLHDSDSRLGYNLRSYTYTNLTPGQSYTATMKKNGAATYHTATIANTANTLSDFKFLAGGCGRIMDMSRCVDQVEGPLHVNGTTDIFKHMATENSDLMVWLGDAVYLFGLEHAQGMCPGMVNDWDNMDALFSRYLFNRQFHDTLLRAMPQLSITDNHDVGGNEFNKTMPTLNLSKKNFMNWWQNPQWLSNSAGQGLYSSYKYKDVEFFLLDNRSYRESTTRHLGPAQLAWLKQSLLSSTATFKVLISGTPSFDKHWGGRNFSITTECDTLIKFIKANNIDGVLCYSADIHEQEFYGRYNDHTYPFFDILSGNLASDIGVGNTSVTPDNDIIFEAIIQTYTRTSIYGQGGDRRFKVDYLSPDGVKYYGAIIHEDMLKSIDDSTKKLALQFANALTDSSKYQRILQGSNISYGPDKDGNALSALVLNNTSSVTVPYAPELNMQDRTFSVAFWVKPAQLPATGYASVFSNSTGNDGYTIGTDNAGRPVFINYAAGKTYTSQLKMKQNKWTHITWKYDNVKLQLFLYWNGQLVQKWSNVPTPAASTGNLYIGTNVNNEHFNGSLDQFHIYGKLITDKLVSALSGYQPNRGTALKMQGTQNVVIPSAEINPTLGSSAFTLEFWARVNEDPATGAKILSSNCRVNNLTTGISFEFSAANKMNIAFGTNGSGWTAISDAGNPWQTGEWNHVALAYQANDSLYLYLNGKKAATAKCGTYFTNTFGLALGKSVYYGQPVQSEMDELRVWNTALSGDSIRKHMHYALTGTEPNLAYYYDFIKHTDTTVVSGGSHNYELLLANASLTPSTAPVGKIAPAYQELVTGNWTIGRNANTGLKLDDAITMFDNNLVVGHHADSTVAQVSAGSAVWYLKGGWQPDQLNMPIGTLSADLTQCLPGYDSISKLASEYYLLKEDANNLLTTVNTGYYDGKNLRFMNTFLDTGIYHIGWKADTSSRLFDRGGALSMLGGHTIRIPYVFMNNVLSGDFTIECWARLMQDMNYNGKLLADNGRVNNNSAGFALEFGANKTINAVMGTNGSGWNTINSHTPWQIGEWNHLAVTASPNGYLRLYVNGALADSSAYTQFYPMQLDMSLGTSIYYGLESIAMMDELRVWKRVKTAEEIRDQMHLSLPSQDTTLVYNYTFNQKDKDYILNTGTMQDSILKTNARIIAATSPVGVINVPQQYHVTGSWSIRDSANNGLSVMVAIPDFETNLVMGKDSLGGSVISPTVAHMENLRTLWQIDPLKLTSGAFDFDGPTVLGSNWATVKAQAIEYYLLKKDSNGDLVVQAVGTETNDKINFTAINMGYGLYTLGWKNNSTGLIETDHKTIKFFPNPSTDYIVLSGVDPQQVAEVFVHNITGQRVNVTTHATAADLRMDVSQLAKGTYVIVMTMKNSHEKTALKFIKL